MTASDAAPTTGPIYDAESLRDRDDVTFHEEADTVDAATVDQLEKMDDMAPVGVRNGDGETLVMQVTETCDWKIPSASVGPNEDFAATARQWAETNAGLGVELDGVEAVWHYEAHSADGDRTAERYFVVFAASLQNDQSSGDGDAEGTEWLTELPADAVAVPGTDLFFE
ncbi:NUDIX domain-containing protein [Halomicroarcula sp. S1AR25-4]|uniref:NUDIX hydrolase n=1 Tax=Haloarcula sp. S1AR25-4 TaxID=2950538 RepID=UPI002875B867|nr:NUDIX hydrolase [Halomicroarcula sp. S1AR25-4]MDS0276898.1 NUDIX domain-containing protein [Halomicroarcula sp. S1AR25-4]